MQPFPGPRRYVFGLLLILFSLIWASPQDSGYQYLSPQPGAEYTSPNTEYILIRFSQIDPYDLLNLDSFIEVTGQSSGLHPGETKIATDGETVIFAMETSFTAQEEAWVSLTPEVAPRFEDLIAPLSYAFYISRSATGVSSAVLSSEKSVFAQTVSETRDQTQSSAVSDQAQIMDNGIAVPADFPHVDITVHDEDADPNYLFIGYDGSVDYGIIFDNEGCPVWYQRGSSARDFKVQANGQITMVGGGGFRVYEPNFVQTSTYKAVNGYSTDDHELKVLADGGYLLIGRRTETVDMRQYVDEGKSAASVRETVLQEFTAAGELIFQWRAWDHFDIRNMENWSYDDKPTSQSIRFPHMNAVDVDTDGHLVLSSKRISEITKINRDSGEIIWRLGGDESQFELVGDPLGNFNVQHAISVIDVNQYLLFDNHWLDRDANSRAVEYLIDTNDMTATMLWQYQADPPYESYHMGNTQRLGNGHTLINWVEAKYPKAMEVRPDGSVAFSMNWADQDSKSYRVFRCPWTGQVTQPYLVTESYDDHVTLIYNAFGHDDVQSYRIYADTQSHPTTLFDETNDPLKRYTTELVNGERYYFRVTAVDDEGRESDFSNQAQVDVQYVGVDDELLTNGDFSAGQESWDFSVSEGAEAGWQVVDGAATVEVTEAGTLLNSVALSQEAIPLRQGKTYQLEFDVSANTLGVFEVFLGQDTVGGTDYGELGLQYALAQSQHISLTFTMDYADDSNARLGFHMGYWAGITYTFDNITLKNVE